MAKYEEDYGGGIGSSLGALAGKVAKRTSGRGYNLGRAAARINKRSSGGGSGRGYSGNNYSERSSGGGNYSGGGGGSYTAPKPPSISSYLGTDSTYQNAVRGGKRSLADFLSDIGRRRGEAGTQFNQTSASMERDRLKQLDDIRQEFASRGLINSGLFGQEQGKFQQTFMDQMNTLKQQQASLLADLLSQETNYKREQELALEAAKQEALLRRAQQYNIGG